MAQAVQVQLPVPDLAAGEDQAAFAMRCHESLADAYPNTDERNRVCMLQWTKTAGDEDVVEKAARKAVSKRHGTTFTELPMTAVFAEHVTRDRDGKPLKQYDRNDMATIVRACNRRIADTGDLAPITDGHTPDVYEESLGIKQPEILGYQGPFYLGMIGNVEPRYAVFARERAYKGKLDKLKELPRRSAELHPSDMILDPVAALGATTPKLNLGMRFSRVRADDGQDKLVERYNADPVDVIRYAASCPGGSNTFVPGEKYAAGDDDPPTNSEPHMALSTEDIQQILSALDQLDWVKAVKQQLGLNAPGGDDSMPTGGPPPGAGGAPGPAGAAAGGPPGAAGMPPGDDGADLADDTPMGADGAGSGDLPPDDDDPEHYAADGSAAGNFFKTTGAGSMSSANPGKPAGNASVNDTVKMSRRVSALEKALAEANGRLQSMSDDRNHYRITSAIEKFSRTHVLDKQEEIVRLSRKIGRLPEDQFGAALKEHCQLIEKNYRRIPVGVEVALTPDQPRQYARTSAADPTRDMAPDEVERFAREVQDHALTHGLDYDKARAAVLARRNGNGAAK